jgi:hypothetical protein
MSVSLAGDVICVKYPAKTGEFTYFYKLIDNQLIKYKRLFTTMSAS